MGDFPAALLIGLPMAATMLAFGWLEVTRLRAIKALGIAAIEAAKQIAIAKAQACPAPAEATGEGGEP